jgi:hypothetical protein
MKCFPFLFLFFPLIAYALRKREETRNKTSFSERGALELHGVCWMAGKCLVAEEEELGYPSYWKKILFKGSNDVAIRCSKCW